MDNQNYKSWIAGIFDRTAETYGNKQADFFNWFAKRLVDHAAIPAGSHVLDVATGRGALLKEAAKKVGPGGKVIGIDISANMIAQTKKTLNEPHIHLLCADGEHLPFEDNSFHTVLCGFGIFFFPDYPVALQEFLRVLKPGGQLWLSTWGERDELYNLFQETYNQFGEYKKTVLHQFEDQAFISEVLTKAGFQVIQLIADELDFIHQNFEDWFSSLWSHASRAKLELLTPEQIIQLKAALKEKLQGSIRPDGIHQLMRVHCTHAIKPIT